MENIVKRSDKLAFLGVTTNNTTTYKRMKGFTELSQSKNPKEHTRQYVDEEFERSDVVGYSPSISFAFDEMEDSDVHAALKNIFDSEAVGADAVVEVLIVDLSAEGTTSGSFAARKREFAVIPDSEGGDLEAYTYSGTFKANGATVSGTATTTDTWATAVFTAAE